MDRHFGILRTTSSTQRQLPSIKESKILLMPSIRQSRVTLVCSYIEKHYHLLEVSSLTARPTRPEFTDLHSYYSSPFSKIYLEPAQWVFFIYPFIIFYHSIQIHSSSFHFHFILKCFWLFYFQFPCTYDLAMLIYCLVLPGILVALRYPGNMVRYIS